MNRTATAFLLSGILFLSACASAGRVTDTGPESALPAVPRVNEPLDIRLTYPEPGALKPNADSTFIFGSVGTGRAELSINGQPVEVAPNGGFLAFVPVPADGSYRLSARTRRQSDTEIFTYAPPPADAPGAASPPPSLMRFPQARLGIVATGRDTLATGSEAGYAAPTPGGDRRWFFPHGTRLAITGQQGGYYQVQFTNETTGWIDSSFVRLEHSGTTPVAPVGPATITNYSGYADVRIPVNHTPFRIDPQLRSVGITVYGRTAPASRIVATTGDLIEQAAWAPAAADSARLDIQLAHGLWGYKVFYDDTGSLVLRIRRPPAIDPQQPLRGLQILIDAGHPPGGAIGPTGLREPEANLDITRRLTDMLEAHGAEVLLTRTSSEPMVSATSSAVELWARVDSAVAWNADLMVSVHNNAFPDGVNPYENFGTETYYYHSFSRPLAEELLKEIVEVTGIPNLGAKQRSLALVRPSWMPSTLTESLFMMFPRQEAALRNPRFLNRLAAAHVEGLENYLRQYISLSSE